MGTETSLTTLSEGLTISASKPGEADLKLAAALAVEARQAVETSGEQQRRAEKARDLLGQTDAASVGEITRLAVWHYKRAAIGFRMAAVNFKSAAKLEKQNKARREMLDRADRTTWLAEQAELAVCELTSRREINMGVRSDETG